MRGGVGCRSSRGFSKSCLTRGRGTPGTISRRFWSSPWRRCCAVRRAAPTWRTSAWRRKGCSGSFLGWNTGSRATTRSAGCSAFSTRWPSRRRFGSSWRPLPSRSGAWSRSMARRCGVPSSVGARRRHCIWSTSGRRMPGLRSPSAWRPTATKWRARWKVLKLLSLKGLCGHRRCAALPCRDGQRASSIARRSTCSPSRRTNRRCLPMRRHFWNRSRTRSRMCATPAMGRVEERRASVVSAAVLARKHGFPGIKAVGRVELRRRAGNTQDPPVVRYFLLSKAFSPKRLLTITTSHWGIEKPTPLGSRCRVRRRSSPQPQGPRPPRTSLWCESSPSTSSGATQTRPPSDAKSSAQDGDDTFLLSIIRHMR